MAVRASWCRTSPHQGHKGQGEEAGSPHTMTGPQTLLLPRHLPPVLDVTVDSRFLPGEGGTPTLRAVTGPGSITCDLAQFSKEKSPMTPGGQQAASRHGPGPMVQRGPLPSGGLRWQDQEPGPGVMDHRPAFGEGPWGQETGPSAPGLSGDAGRPAPPSRGSSYR